MISVLIVVLAVAILGPVAYAISFWHDCMKSGDRKSRILGILAVVYVALVYVWIFVFKCGRVF